MPDPQLGCVPSPPGQVPSTATQPAPPPTAPPGNPTTTVSTDLSSDQLVQQVVDVTDDGCWRAPLAAVRPVGQRPAQTARAARRAAARRHLPRVTHAKR